MPAKCIFETGHQILITLTCVCVCVYMYVRFIEIFLNIRKKLNYFKFNTFYFYTCKTTCIQERTASYRLRKLLN